MIDIENIDINESVTRYILTRRHFSIEKKTVKVGAFYPPPKSDKNKISVFRILGLNENEIWEMGVSEVGEKRGKDIMARGDLLVENIIHIGIDVKPFIFQQNIRHADIIYPDDEIKAKSFATELALIAELKLV